VKAVQLPATYEHGVRTDSDTSQCSASVLGEKRTEAGICKGSVPVSAQGLLGRWRGVRREEARIGEDHGPYMDRSQQGCVIRCGLPEAHLTHAHSLVALDDVIHGVSLWPSTHLEADPPLTPHV